MRRVLYLLLAAMLPAGIYAQTVNRDLKREAATWDQLRAVAPNLVDTFKEATIKMDRNDYLGGAVLYQQVVDGAPAFDPAVRRLGTCLASAGDTQRGLIFLEKAVELNRSPANLFMWATFLAFPGKGKEVPRETRQRALTLALEANRGNQPDRDTTTLVAQLALMLDNEREFRLASSLLMDKFVDEPLSHYFNAIRLAMDERWVESEDEIRLAQKLGLAPDIARDFLDSGVHFKASAWRYGGYSVWVIAAWAGGLLLLFLAGKILSGLTLRSIERTAASGNEVSSPELVLRKAYRKLINLAAFYYYVSLPVVILLLIGVAGSIFYAFMMAGRIPIRLMAILVVGTIVTIYKMVQMLFIKVKQEDPGRMLNPSEAPGLWSLAQKVADELGTRPIEEIRITPGTEMAVYERGTRAERSRDKGKRVLILGVGLVNGFRTDTFRAVLGHEYGHFAHRDTAGGDAALRVSNDIMKFALAMVYGGHAVWWNIGFQFVRLYDFLFRRISFGASRLQEVLADRKAALLYGSAAFEEGLRHVVRRSAEFNHVANQEIRLARSTGSHIHNLYDLSVQSEFSVDAEVEKSLNRKSSEDDTHPSPADRFRFIRQVAQASGLPEETTMVWDLFVNRAAITSEMTSWINQAVPHKVTEPSESASPAVFVCNDCGTPWNPEEYRSDAAQIFCSSCKQELVVPHGPDSHTSPEHLCFAKPHKIV